MRKPSYLETKAGKNKIPLTNISMMVLLLAIGWLLYSYFGHRLIQTMYEGRSIEILNSIIEGQAVHPVEFYFEKADRLFFQLNVYLIGISIGIGIFLRRRHENLDLQSHERTIFLFPLVFAFGCVFIYVFLPDWYLWLVKEDSIVENLQAGSYFFASAITFTALTKLRKSHHKYIFLILLMFACGTLFIFFEEISWGQRILGIKTPEFFNTYNMQKEITLHNVKPACKVTHIIYMLLGLYGGLAWIFTRNFKWGGANLPRFIIPEWYCSLYFLPSFFFNFHHHYILEWPNRGYYIWPQVANWRHIEPCELLLALGFLLLADSNYRKAIDLIKTP